MSPRTRTRARAEAPTFAGDALQEARNLKVSSSQADIKQIWENLCQHYVRDLHAGLIHDLFPYWVLRSIPGYTIEQLTEAVYNKGSALITALYTNLPKHFKVPGWQFNLFLGALPQSKLRVLSKVAKDRTDITFDDLFQELCRFRSQREALPDGPFDFETKEIRSCFPEGDSKDVPEGSNSEDVFEDNFDTDSEEDDAICATEGSEDDFRCDTVDNHIDSFDDTFNNPAHYGSSRSSRSPMTNALNRYAASPIETTSITSAANLVSCATHTRRSATVDTEILIAGQSGSERQRQAVDAGDHGATRPPNREPMADILDCTDDIEDPRLVDICNYSNRLISFAGSLRKVNEELRQDRRAIARENLEVIAGFNAEIPALIEVVKGTLAREADDTLRATMSRLGALCEKHRTVETKNQEYQVKRRRYDTDVDDLKSQTV